MNPRIVLQLLKRLLFRYLHLLDLLLEEQLRSLMLECPKLIPLGGIRVFVEQNKQRKDKDERTDNDHQKHRALVDEFAERRSFRVRRLLLQERH